MIQHLRTLLLTQTAITNIVGTRIYSHVEPQSPTYPLILLTKMSTNPLGTLDGTNGLERVDVDLDCKAETLNAADALGEIVKDFIKDYTGVMGAVLCESVQLQNDQYSVEEALHAKDARIFTRLLDLQFQYK